MKLIEFKPNYEKWTEPVAVAPNLEIAENYIEEIKREYEHLYGSGEFFVGDIDYITEKD